MNTTQASIVEILPYDAAHAAAMETVYITSVRANPDGFIQFLDYHGSIIAYVERVIAAGGRASLALVDGEVSGMVVLNPINQKPGEATLCKLHVLADKQGLGLGRRLAQAMLDDAQTLGFERVILDVTISQKPAIALYQKLGFEVEREEDWRGEYQGHPLRFEILHMARQISA